MHNLLQLFSIHLQAEMIIYEERPHTTYIIDRHTDNETFCPFQNILGINHQSINLLHATHGHPRPAH